MKRYLDIYFLDKYDAINYVNKQQSFLDYLNKIDSSQYYHETSGELNNGIKNDFLNFFNKSLLNWSPIEKYFMKLYIKEANKLLDKYPLFKKYPWIISKTDPKLLHGASFTFGKSIFISQKSVDNGIQYYRKTGKLKEYTLGTFIHEKIHVLQRYNQDKFDRFYLKQFPFMRKVNKIPNLIKKYILNHNLTNPDGLDLNWVYVDNDKVYYPLVPFDKDKTNSLKEQALDQNLKTHDLKDLPCLKKYIDILPKYGNNLLGLYHPNELIAHILDTQIVKNSVNLEYINELFD